jgi:hypothetical protein
MLSFPTGSNYRVSPHCHHPSPPWHRRDDSRRKARRKGSAPVAESSHRMARRTGLLQTDEATRGLFGFDFYPIFGPKMQKHAQTGCVFSGVSSLRVCGPWRIHGRDDSPKSNSRSAFPKNQSCSPPCPPPESPTHPESPAAPDSSPICDSGVLPGLPSLAQAPALAPRFMTLVRRPVFAPSHATPVLIPCPLCEQDIRSAPGPSRARCTSTTRPTPLRCRPKCRARASPCAISALLHDQRLLRI